MRISKQLEELKGIRKASAMMATDNNKNLLRDAGLLTDEIAAASPNDLVIAIDATSPEIGKEAISTAERLLAERVPERVGEVVHRTLGSAVAAEPEANLVLVSVPGAFAAREAMRALQAGKHVMIFSDDVPLEDEVRLKRFASERSLLVMGPDCGTALVGRVGLGFSNVVRSGPIGIVGAAGTGIQQVASLVNEVGLSHAIGTGSRDLSDAVGGAMMIAGLKALEADEQTRVIVVISKPPAPKTAKKVLNVIKRTKKPVVVDFIGGDLAAIKRARAIPAFTLEDAAAKAIALARRKKPKEIVFTMSPDEIKRIVEQESKRLGPKQKYIRGLFSGGTFCSEAMLILRELIGDVYSNIPLKPKLKLRDVQRSKLHTCIDMGTEEFTRGVPHPMIDFRFRRKRLLREAKDPTTAVILLDLVIGYGAHPDPAGELAETIKKARAAAKRAKRYLPVVVSICGTPQDPQGFASQRKKLEAAGAIVMPSNAQAVRLAALIATRGKVWRKLE
jgi:succinyl-CoA synthetase alpha subunit